MHTNPTFRLLGKAISAVRFPAIFLVVLIHADNRDIWLHGQARTYAMPSGLAAIIRHLLSQEIARVAVPMLFAISGYLFFRGFDGSIQEWKRKLTSRAKSVLAPYLAWELLHFALSLISGHGNYAPGDAVLAILGIGRPPLAFHLWFLRDLALWMACTPALYILLRYLPKYWTICALALWLLPIWPWPRPGAVGLACFSLGGMLALQGWEGRGVIGYWKPWAITYGLAVAFCSSSLFLQVSDPMLRTLASRLTLLVGCGAAIASLARLSETMPKAIRPLEWLAPASFFVYAAHEPLQRLIRSWFARTGIERLDQGAWTLYFLPALAVTGICLTLYYLVIRRSLWLRTLLAGDR